MALMGRKNKNCTIESIDKDYVTITIPYRNGRHMKGQQILVTIPVEKRLALSGRQTINEVVARGKVVSTTNGKITVHSPADDVVSLQARESALANKQSVTIKAIKHR